MVYSSVSVPAFVKVTAFSATAAPSTVALTLTSSPTTAVLGASVMVTVST